MQEPPYKQYIHQGRTWSVEVNCLLIRVSLCQRHSSTMADNPSQEYVNMVKCLGWAEGNQVQAALRYRELYPNAQRFPSEAVMAAAERRTSETGNIMPLRGRNGEPRVRRQVHQREERVLEIVEEDPETSTRTVARQMGMSKTTVWQILKTNNIKPFHKTPVQVLHPGDPPRRLEFCQWLVRHYEADNEFPSRILFTDEASFTESGVRNCHNEHVYSDKDENPHAIRKRGHQVRWSINLWAGII